MENKSYYIEAVFKIESQTKQEVLSFLDELKRLETSFGVKDGGVIIKENPVYDSFGNLWE